LYPHTVHGAFYPLASKDVRFDWEDAQKVIG